MSARRIADEKMRQEVIFNIQEWAEKHGFRQDILPKPEDVRILSQQLLERSMGKDVFGMYRSGARKMYLSRDYLGATDLPNISVHEGIHFMQHKTGTFSNKVVERLLGKENMTHMVESMRKAGYHPSQLNPIDAVTHWLQNLTGVQSRVPNPHTLQILNDIKQKLNLQSGSFISGSGSGDKIPAMLEPGEFVLNRNAVKAVGVNKLEHINKKHGRFQKGGAVKAQSGGSVIGLDVSLLDNVIQKFGTYVDILTKSVNSMVGLEIQLRASHEVNVNFNGLQVMSGLNDSIKQLVITETNKAINKMLNDKFNLPPLE